MSKPIRPKQALAAWKKSSVGQSSTKFQTLMDAQQLRARIDLAFMAGFDAGAKAEHKKQLRVKFVTKKTKG